MLTPINVFKKMSFKSKARVLLLESRLKIIDLKIKGIDYLEKINA